MQSKIFFLQEIIKTVTYYSNFHLTFGWLKLNLIGTAVQLSLRDIFTFVFKMIKFNFLAKQNTHMFHDF